MAASVRQTAAGRRARRRIRSGIWVGAATAATLLALIPLLSILVYVAARGISLINWQFLTELPKPVGEPGGGVANALAGTLVVVGLACLLGVPVGVASGVYLAEYGQSSRLAPAIRFVAGVLTGVPSIAIGIVAYEIMVKPVGHFSAYAGGVALAMILLPVVAMTTEEMIRLVPRSLREAALALGIPYWRTVLRVVLPTAGKGIMTGLMLGVARIAGETAPLLFTALGNQFWSRGLNQPTSALPLQIFSDAISAYAELQQRAWATALVLVLLVLVLNIAARALARGARLS